ncbi:hypothetical protein HK102_006301 [Quaeritorhiza haematococci]|nr:hypothetical protein HK102_006301 [Quaeritorhiza haematococci]
MFLNLIALTIVIAALLATLLLTPKRTNPSIPEADGALPFFGHQFKLLPYLRKLHTHLFLLDLFYSRDGNNNPSLDSPPRPLVQLRFPDRTVVFASDADVAKKALTSDADFYRDDRILRAFSGIAEFMLFVLPSGDVWKRHRKFLQPAFGPVHLRHAGVVALEKASELVENVWKRKVEEAAKTGETYTVDLHHHYTTITAEVIGEVAFSHKMGLVDDLLSGSSNEEFKHMERMTTLGQKRIGVPAFLWDYMGLGSKSVSASVNHLHSILNNVIETKKKKLAETSSMTSTQSVQDDDDNHSKVWKMDALDRLIEGSSTASVISNAPSQSVAFSEKEMVDEVLGLFLAGHETTANTLTWVSYELSLPENEHVREKLEKEIDLLWETTGGELDYQSLSSLKYTEQVIKETLRKHATVQAIPRVAKRDMVLETGDQKFPIQKETRIVISVQALHLNPKYWSNPEKFDPDRWEESRKAELKPGAFLPFGDGPMNCIGQKMALIEMKAILAIILRHHRFSLVPGQDFTGVMSITLGLKNGLFVNAVSQVCFAFQSSGTNLSPLQQRSINMILNIAWSLIYPTMYLLLWQLRQISISTKIREKLRLCSTYGGVSWSGSVGTLVICGEGSSRGVGRDCGHTHDEEAGPSNAADGKAAESVIGYELSTARGAHGSKHVSISLEHRTSEFDYSPNVSFEHVDQRHRTESDDYSDSSAVSFPSMSGEIVEVDQIPRTDPFPTYLKQGFDADLNADIEDGKVREEINIEPPKATPTSPPLGFSTTSCEMTTARTHEVKEITDDKETPREHLIRNLNMYRRRGMSSYWWRIFWILWSPFAVYILMVYLAMASSFDESLDFMLAMHGAGVACLLILFGWVVIGTQSDRLGYRFSLLIAVAMFTLNLIFTALDQFQVGNADNTSTSAASIIAMASMYVALLALVVGPSVDAVLENSSQYHSSHARAHDYPVHSNGKKKRKHGKWPVSAFVKRDQNAVDRDDATMVRGSEDTDTLEYRMATDDTNLSTTSTRTPFPSTIERAQSNWEIIQLFSDPPKLELDAFGQPPLCVCKASPGACDRYGARVGHFLGFITAGSRHSCKDSRKRTGLYGPGCGRWSQTLSLEDILADVDLSAALSSFLAREFAVENLLFLEAAEDYCQTAAKITQKLCILCEQKKEHDAHRGQVVDNSASSSPVQTASALAAVYVHHMQTYLLSRAQTIIDEFLRPGSPNEIIITSELRDRVMRNVERSARRVWSFDPSMAVPVVDRELQDFVVGASPSPPQEKMGTSIRPFDLAHQTVEQETAMDVDVLPQTIIDVDTTAESRTVTETVFSISPPASVVAPGRDERMHCLQGLEAVTFEDAVGYVKFVMREDVIPKFKKSEEYRKAIEGHQWRV